MNVAEFFGIFLTDSIQTCKSFSILVPSDCHSSLCPLNQALNALLQGQEPFVGDDGSGYSASQGMSRQDSQHQMYSTMT